MADLSRRAFGALAGGLAWQAVKPAFAAASPCTRPSDDTAGGLWQGACRRGLLFGTAVAGSDLAVPDYAALVLRECSVLTATWEMKWGSVQPQPGQFDFSGGDRIAGFARTHGLALRGHTLVWYQNMPGWLPAALTSGSWYGVLSRHAAQVMGRWRNQVVSWDVVNEAVEPTDGRADGLRDNAWLRAGGPSYVAEAFKLAAHFAPDTQLVYNDYGVEHEADWTRKRRRAILGLLERARAADAPIHGLGLQSHLRVGDAFDAKALGQFLAEVRGMGVTPLVTELDVRADRVSGAADKDRRTADLAQAYLETVLAAGCRTVVCWGLSDDKSWRGAEEPDDRPLPFDRALRRKPLYDAIRTAIDTSAS